MAAKKKTNRKKLGRAKKLEGTKTLLTVKQKVID